MNPAEVCTPVGNLAIPLEPLDPPVDPPAADAGFGWLPKSVSSTLLLLLARDY